MQGSILYIDEKQGFLQGADQNRYYFTDLDWRGSSAPITGQPVTFQPDGQNAREVQPQVLQASGWPPSQNIYQGSAPSGNPYVQPGRGPLALKSVYNIPLAVAAFLLLVSLILPYGKLFVEYRLTDTGFQGFYFVLPVALIVVSLLGLPRLWPLLIWGGSVIATLASVMDQDSLFSRLGAARDQFGQLSAVAGSIFNSRIEDQMRSAVPSLGDNLSAGFYLHVIALLATGLIVLLFKYEVRAGRVALEGIGAMDGADLARAGRDFVAGAERLTGQSVPTGQETGSFFRSFLTFNKMIAPTLITIMYYINMVIVVFVGIGLIFSGLFFTRYGGLAVSFYGLLLLIFGPLWVRLIAEFFIVIFKIHGHLRQIDEKTRS